jgi:8-oxo-dGTP pyrophosphatase MutT (NUDIX family)
MADHLAESGPSWSRDGDGEHDRTLEENWLLRLRRERFRSRASGQVHYFYVTHLADAVNVIALTPDRRVILVRQFRAGSCRDSLETPGGLLEPGEDPTEAGVRELLEETGYAGVPTAVLGTVWSNPSLLTSRTTFILVSDARRVAEPRLDQGEELGVELVPESAVPRMIRDGRIDHALVVCGLLWWSQAKFPGRLAAPAPKRPLHIGWIMLSIAVVALVLGFLMNLSSPAGTAIGLLVILSAVVFTVVSSIWPSPTSRKESGTD